MSLDRTTLKLAIVAALTSGLWLPEVVRADTNALTAIDLPTALRLAGAQSLEVRLAAEQLREAEAEHQQAQWRFFPWLEPTVGYRRHEGNIQDVGGTILDVSKESYAAGGSLNARVELGDAIYESLAARQQVQAAEEGLEARRRDAALEAASAYFELARTKAAAGVARESVRLANDYSTQVEAAVESGLAFPGDLHRARIRIEQNRILLRQSEEQRRIANVRLAQVLRLDPSVDLDPAQNELVPVSLLDPGLPATRLVEQALASRPELRQAKAYAESRRQVHRGTKYGPLIPTLQARADFYGLGGGRDGDLGSFDGGQDYAVGLSWRVGPGGLFDSGRTRSAESREQAAQIELEQARDAIIRQVIESRARAQSLHDQLAMAQRAMTAAEDTFRLSRERRDFGIGAVLETIQAEEDLTRSRLTYLEIVSAQNQAQFALQHAVGDTALQTDPQTAHSKSD